MGIDVDRPCYDQRKWRDEGVNSTREDDDRPRVSSSEKGKARNATKGTAGPVDTRIAPLCLLLSRRQ